MFKFTILSLVCWMVITAEQAEAQFVRVGPGGGVSVRAPFVHVEVGPGGGTYVRAPFTSVVTPGYGRPVPRYEYWTGRATSSGVSGRLRSLRAERIAQSTATALREMDWRELRRHARAVSVRLENELRRVADGTVLSTSLRPGTIRDLLAVDLDQPPSQATASQLAEILLSYDALAESNSFPRITRLSGFREMRQALVELTLPPSQRARRNLAAQWTAFHRDLYQFESGASWQEYLALPSEMTAAHDDATASSVSQSPVAGELQRLEELLTRYEQVVGPDEYQAVAQLPSFKATRRHLANYVDLLRDSATDSSPEVSRPETIPTPRPLP